MTVLTLVVGSLAEKISAVVRLVSSALCRTAILFDGRRLSLIGMSIAGLGVAE